MGLTLKPNTVLDKIFCRIECGSIATASSMALILKKVCSGLSNQTASLACDTRNVSKIANEEDLEVQPTNSLAWNMIIHGLIGWIGAIALTIERIHIWLTPDATLSCDLAAFVSCKSVMLQNQAAVFGFPNSFVGVFAFMAPIALGIASLMGYRYKKWVWRVFFSGIFMGFIFSLWLFSQSVFVIAVLCPYCMVVWAGMLPLFFRVYSFGISDGFVEAPKWLKARSQGFYDWAWVWALSLEVFVLVTIIATFWSRWPGLWISLTMAN
jgi:uncharacterized membrane protein